MNRLLLVSRALSDESRLRVLMALSGGELCLCQLIELLGLAPSTVSKHMQLLQQAGLVDYRKQGRWRFYRLSDPETASPEVRELFEELAEQEKRHYAAFSQLTRTVWEQSPSFQGDWDQYLMYLQASIQSTFFQGSDKALSLAQKVSDEKEALQMALGFEKETMLFFYDLRDKVSDADKPVVERIIAEERAHVHRLAAMI